MNPDLLLLVVPVAAVPLPNSFVLTGFTPVASITPDKTPQAQGWSSLGIQQPHRSLPRYPTEIATPGTSFKDKNALLTRAGKGSIVEIVKGLLVGGARAVITISSYNRKTVGYYQPIYHEVGSRGSL